jgi:pyruvate dehydrogenase E2 component (dihydrolipoamide acetyltransferase)
MSVDFRLPDLGEGVHEGQVLRVLVREGERVREDQPIIEVETDKSAVEIPSPRSGIVSRVHVSPGQVVQVGAVLVTYDAGGSAAPPAAVGPSRGQDTRATAERTRAAMPDSRAAPGPAPADASSHASASPAVRKLARELGVDLDSLRGSGPGGRVTREDVERASARGGAVHAGPRKDSPRPPQPPTAAAAPPVGTPDRDAWGEIVRVPITRARRTVADVVSRSWSIPTVTDTDDADVTDLDRLRRGYRSRAGGERKLTIFPFVVRAVAVALREFPDFNASWDGERGEIVYRRYVSISVGVHTERGLIAPVVRRADERTIPQIADDIARLAALVRSGSFDIEETRGGTFTLSNAGAVGGSRYATPLLVPPQVGILALGRSRLMPWVVEGALSPRLILPMSLTFDHRAIDGGIEIGFMRRIIEMLEQPAQLLL